MSTRQKSFLAVAASVVALVIIVYFTSSTILLNGFSQLEEQDTRSNVTRVQDTLASDLANLNNSAGDWANWDETYNFVQDANSAYIDSNLSDSSVAQIRVELLTIVDTQGKVVYARAYDMESEQATPVPESWLALINPSSPLLRHVAMSDITGLVVLPEGPVLFAARPILTNEGLGPSRGTLIFGRYLHPAEVKRLSMLTHLSLEFYPLGDPKIPAALKPDSALADKGTINVQPLDAKTIAGSTVLFDIYDKPALLLAVTLPRSIYAQGQQSGLYLLGSLIIIGIILIGAVQVLIDRLWRSQSAQQQSETRYRTLSETAPDLILIVDRDGAIQYTNDYGAQLLGHKLDELKGKKLVEFFSSYNGQWGARLQEVFKADAPAHWEELDTLPAGEFWLDFRLVPMTDPSGRMTLALAIARDITDRKRTEEALREEEARIRTVLETAREAIISGDTERGITAWNPAAQMIYGHREPEVYGHALTMLIPDRFRAVIDNYIHTPSWGREVIMDGATFETCGLRKDGTEFPAEFSITTRETAQGNTFTAIVRDITERKKSEMAEREALTLAEAMRDTATALTGPLTLDEVLDRILDNVGRVLPHDTSTILMIEQGVGRLARWRDPGGRTPPEWIAHLRLPIDQFPSLQRIVENGTPALVSDTALASDWVDFNESKWVRSMLAIPIRIKGETVGVLSLYSATPDFFKPDQLSRLQVFADQAAAAIDSARLLDETQKRALQLSLLYDARLALNSARDLRTQLELLVKIAMMALHADRAEFFRYDSLSDALSFVFGIGYADEVHRTLRDFTVCRGQERGLVGVVARDFLPLYVPDVSADVRWVPVDSRVRSFLAVPVEHDNHLLGVLSVLSEKTDAFSPQDGRMLTLYANQAAVAIENGRVLERGERRRERLAACERVYELINRGVRPAVTLDVLISRLIAEKPEGAVNLLQYDPDTKVLTSLVSQGFRYPALAHTARSSNPNWPGRAALEGQVVHYPNLYKSGGLKTLWPDLGVEEFNAYYAWPVRVHGEVRGVLELLDRVDTEPDQEWLDWIQTAAGLAAVIIQQPEPAASQTVSLRSQLPG